jgi:hypothetical protein
MALKAVPIAAKSLRCIDVPVVGWIREYQAAQGLLVDYPGNPGPPLPARATIPFDAELAQQAAEQNAPVILIFENGKPAQPIIIGWVKETTNLPHKQPRRGESPAAGASTEVVVDGRRVVLNGEDEVVLCCGKASITLRRNGAVIIKGAHLVSHSSGVNRIRGGSVQLN